MDGNGKMLELLERIAGGIEGTNERLDATNERLDATNERLDTTRDEMRQGFAAVNTRLDNVIKIVGSHHSDHEQRISALEERVFKKSS